MRAKITKLYDYLIPIASAITGLYIIILPFILHRENFIVPGLLSGLIFLGVALITFFKIRREAR